MRIFMIYSIFVAGPKEMGVDSQYKWCQFAQRTCRVDFRRSCKTINPDQPVVCGCIIKVSTSQSAMLDH